MDLKCQTPADVLKAAKDNKVKIVDVKFIDMPGMWQHFSVPLHELEDSSFTDGYGFDGSSIRGYQNIDQSDMLVVPDATTAMLKTVIQKTQDTLFIKLRSMLKKVDLVTQYILDQRQNFLYLIVFVMIQELTLVFMKLIQLKEIGTLVLKKNQIT